MEEWIFVESAFSMQCDLVKNTLLRTAFSAIFPVGITSFEEKWKKVRYINNSLYKKDLLYIVGPKYRKFKIPEVQNTRDSKYQRFKIPEVQNTGGSKYWRFEILEV